MSSANTYQNDGMEIKFDPQATDSVTNSIVGLQMTVQDSTGGVTGWADFPGVCARKTTADGYVLEAAIPWESIATTTESVDVAVDSVFGLCMQNHDNDNTTGARDASIQWAAVMLDAAWNQPKYLATAKFLAGNKLQLIPSNNMTGVTNTLPYDGTVPTGIVVDGKMDPFYHLLTGPDDGFIQVKSYSHSEVGTPHGDADLSAKVWGSWDTDWLYLYVEMTDDTISLAGVTNNWETDAMELKIDGWPTDSTQIGGSACSKTCIFTAIDSSVATTAAEKAVCDNLTAWADADKMYARGTRTGGYILEYAIKIDTLGGSEPIDAAVDSIFGIGMNFIDNDGLHGRQAAIIWGAISGDHIWDTVKYHGTVKFLADHKIAFIAENNMTGHVNPVPFDGTPFWMNIDAAKDPFYYTLSRPTDGYLQLRYYAWNDNGFLFDDADLSAKIWTAWDDSCFYVYEEVKDDVISMTSTNTYQNDGMELKFDPQATDSVANSIVGLQMTVQDSTGGVTGWANFPGTFARKTVSGGYILEAAIPWSDIATTTESVDVGVNNVFGAVLQNHDNDNDTGARDGSVMWGAVMLDAAWNTPKYLGTVKFLAGNKLNYTAKNNMTGVTNSIPYDGRDYYRNAMDDTKAIAYKFSLNQNYPNPFNPITTISYGIEKASDVRLTVYDIMGRQVATLVNEAKKPGFYNVQFDASRMASGLYLYRIEAGSFVKTHKMMLLK